MKSPLLFLILSPTHLISSLLLLQSLSNGIHWTGMDSFRLDLHAFKVTPSAKHSTNIILIYIYSHVKVLPVFKIDFNLMPCDYALHARLRLPVMLIIHIIHRHGSQKLLHVVLSNLKSLTSAKAAKSSTEAFIVAEKSIVLE